MAKKFVTQKFRNTSKGKDMTEVEDACGSREEDKVEDYDAEIRNALQQMDICQNEIDNLNEKAAQEIINVERKYNRMRKVHFDKRNDLVKTIPKFWATAFSNHPHISTILETEELECLNYLTKLEVEENDDIGSGYRISFYFEENPYLENDVITKEFHLETHKGSYSVNTPIKWKLGNELLKKQKRPTQGRKRSLDPKYFFSWFEDHTDPSSDDIAEVIKDDLWPNPLQYYVLDGMEEESEYHGYSVITSEEAVDGKEEIEVLGDEEEEEEEEIEEEELEIIEEEDVAIIED